MQGRNAEGIQRSSFSDLVSVVIPTCNRPEFLRRAIGSTIRQTHGNFEIIVVDGGPGEEVKSVIEGLGDSRTKYLKQDPNTGLSAARNIGIRNSAGRFIAFLDDDDE
jgi:glycosyltransferase involved in cell wall biosynthesis